MTEEKKNDIIEVAGNEGLVAYANAVIMSAKAIIREYEAIKEVGLAKDGKGMHDREYPFVVEMNFRPTNCNFSIKKDINEVKNLVVWPLFEEIAIASGIDKFDYGCYDIERYVMGDISENGYDSVYDYEYAFTNEDGLVYSDKINVVCNEKIRGCEEVIAEMQGIIDTYGK